MDLRVNNSDGKALAIANAMVGGSDPYRATGLVVSVNKTMLVVRDPVFFRSTVDTARWTTLRDAFMRLLVARHFELYSVSPPHAEVRSLEAACFPGLKPMPEALMVPGCEIASRQPLLCSEEARKTGLKVERLLGQVLKPLHDFKRVSERIYWCAWEVAGVREHTDTAPEAVTLQAGKLAGQQAIKAKMKDCLGKGMDGLLGRDWRQVYSCHREILARNLPARCLQLFELHDLVQQVAWTTELSDGGWKLVQCVFAKR